jgi:large repetitive protein
MRDVQGRWGLWFGNGLRFLFGFLFFAREFMALRWRTSAGRSIVFNALAVLFAVFLSANNGQADTQYIYDSAGRLIQAVDADGSSLQYQYDASGNTISIHRLPANVVTISNFSPTRGPAGTSVTIWGSGFDPATQQNTVTFNGIGAAVTSATATSMVAIVPAGATTGPIAVSNTTGSATSNAVFTVGSQVTIANFTPSRGIAGTLITLNGTSFDPVAANNTVKFNGTTALVTSASGTQLQVQVPTGAGSGQISVANSNGMGVSATDFIIPPGSVGTAAIDGSARIQSQATPGSYAISTGKVGLYLFDGVTGQRLSLGLSGLTTSPSSGGYVAVTVYKPDGSVLTSCGNISPSGGGCELAVLPISGTYTIVVDPPTTYTASFTLTLSQDVTATVIVNTPPVTFSTSRVGQNAHYFIDMVAGHNYAVAVSNRTLGNGGYLGVTVYKPDGSTLSSMGPIGNDALDLMNVPVTGTYRVLINPPGTATGSLQFGFFL